MEETYKGYQIRYDAALEKFVAAIGDDNYRNPSLPKVKKYIDGLDRKSFKRVNVIVERWCGMAGMVDAVVTSCPEGQDSGYEECWVSFKDKGPYHSRSKVSIGKAYLDNASNREILAMVREKEDAIEAMNAEMSELKESLESYKPGAEHPAKARRESLPL